MDEPIRDEESSGNPEVGYERSDASFRAIVWFGVAMLLAFVVIQVGLWWMLKFWRDQGLVAKTSRYGQETPLAAQRPANPQLEGLNPLGELRTWRGPAQAQLHSYGWVQGQPGVARIPIDRAMELVVAEQSRQPPPQEKRGTPP